MIAPDLIPGEPPIIERGSRTEPIDWAKVLKKVRKKYAKIDHAFVTPTAAGSAAGELRRGNKGPNKTKYDAVARGNFVWIRQTS